MNRQDANDLVWLAWVFILTFLLLATGCAETAEEITIRDQQRWETARKMWRVEGADASKLCKEGRLEADWCKGDYE